mmetsp:Transcript_73392/g.130170  ORF Transcript_73392/g.130170 Transcript_73392/m.130170 type:complete len:227 (+) Transcript_73392:63-743(+)
MALSRALVSLCCLQLLSIGPQAAGSESTDDTVALQVDLPPDVQRMFEEMCEMEGISQSEMLTRWIDARWEAMGYTDADLEGFNMSAEAIACELDGRCGQDVGSGKGAQVEQTKPPQAPRQAAPAEERPAEKRQVPSATAADRQPIRQPPRQPPRQPLREEEPPAEKRQVPPASSASRQPIREVAEEAVQAEDAGQEEDEEEEDEDQGLMDLDQWMKRHGGGEDEEL